MAGLLGRWTQQPNERLSYTVDFAEWLAERPGNSIASYTVAATVGLSIVAHSRNGAAISVLLSGGAVGTTYKITVTVTTSVSSEVKEAEFTVKIKET